MVPKRTEAGFSAASSGRRSLSRMGAGSPAPPQHTPAEVSSARAAARAAVRAGGRRPEPRGTGGGLVRRLRLLVLHRPQLSETRGGL